MLFRVIEECPFSMAGVYKSMLPGDFTSRVQSRYISRERDVSEARLQLETAEFERCEVNAPREDYGDDGWCVQCLIRTICGVSNFSA